MGPLIILLFLVLLVGLPFIGNLFRKKEEPLDSNYLKKLTDFVEGELEEGAGSENSYRIRFEYEGCHFVYQEFDEAGFKKSLRKGLLRAVTEDNLNVSFTESSRTKVKATVECLNDIANPWAKTAEKVPLPKELEDFSVFTNNIPKAKKLLDNDDVINVLKKYVNRDALGLPSLSLEISDGDIVLHLHTLGAFKPRLYELQSNVTTIINHLDRLMVVAEVLMVIKKDMYD